MRFSDLVFGYDLSYYQGAVNWDKLLSTKPRFAVLRAAYGVTKDVRFDEYMRQAAGRLPLSAYGFYQPEQDPRKQANALIGFLEPYRSTLRRVWIDLEYWWEGMYASPLGWLLYRDTLRAAGWKTGIYTRASWWDGRVGGYAARFSDDPFWVAQYNNTLTMIPAGTRQVMLWQNKVPAIGVHVGVSSVAIDHNLWNIDVDFESEWGTTPPTGGTGMIPGKAKETLGNMPSIRSAPSRGAAKVGTLGVGATIEFVEIVPSTMAHVADLVSDRWFKRPDGTYVNYLLGGVQYFAILSQPVPDVTPPPPPTPPPAGVPAVADFTLASGSTYVFRDAAGKVIIEGKVP